MVRWGNSDHSDIWHAAASSPESLATAAAREDYGRGHGNVRGRYCTRVSKAIGARRVIFDLIKVGGLREMSNGPLRADEQDYVCTTCGTAWMHETGNAGFGWVEQ